MIFPYPSCALYTPGLTPSRMIAIVNQLVNDPSQLDAVFAALADATRRGILTQLARRGTATIGELAEPYPISAPAITKHIRVLEEAGLIEREIDGRLHRCRLTTSGLSDVTEWVDRTRRFWESQFDSLARHLERKRKEKA